MEREQEAIREKITMERMKEEVERARQQNSQRSEATERMKEEIEEVKERMREEKEAIERAQAMLKEYEEESDRLIEQVEMEIERMEAELGEEREEWRRTVEQLEENKNNQMEREIEMTRRRKKGMEEEQVLITSTMELVDGMIEAVERDKERMKEEKNEMERRKERLREEGEEVAERMVKKEVKKEKSEISEEIEGILFKLERIEADMTRSLEADTSEECMREMEKMEGQAQVDECRRETQHGLIVNPAKCQFGVPSIDFLGHHITSAGATPLPLKVKAVLQFPRPTTVKALQEFLGMDKPPKHIVDWSSEMSGSFSATKEALANATMLAHPVPDAPIALTSDASDRGVGAVLEQQIDGVWKPLAFFSRQLRASEQKYSTFDRELLALYLAVRHFRFLLEARPFTAFVDHKPLTFVMAKLSEPWSARQQRHLSYVSEFTTDIQHVAGKQNTVADCLSRTLTSTVHLGIDYARMAVDQDADPDIQAFRTATTGLQLVDVPFDDKGATLLCDVSTGQPQPRPLAPKMWRRKAFDVIHGLSHPGRKPSRRLVTEKFVWHGMKKDIRDWVKTCIACQRTKSIDM
ncbi:hypothetical protein AAFF_G00161280 [Aldrovandia affinis]|uniref:Gypsy retrotransposon integrase-like protein 1 n=1 Tax=Aldrovandia affinis TaxID=143900 RepID=A0AAD7W7C5_9TELE|nr:hypothetical protein AAFF_G00161280 [Aldrovandia affinis]